MATHILELEDKELEDRLSKLECEIARKREVLEILASSISDAHAVIERHQQERVQFSDKLLVSEEVSPLVEEVKAAKELLDSRQLRLQHLKEGQAAEKLELEDLQRELEALLATKAESNDVSNDVSIGGIVKEIQVLKEAARAEEALCSTIKDQLSSSTPSLLQPPHNHREMFDKMLDEVVNQCYKTIDLSRTAAKNMN